MRDVTEHEKETERARRGLLSTLHVDIETSCRMGGLHIGRSKRVSFGGTLSMERQVRKVQRLRNEAGTSGIWQSGIAINIVGGKAKQTS